MSFDMIVRGGTVVFPQQGVQSADIAISAGRIAAILAPGKPAEAAKTIDATGRHVFPGLVEAHLHFSAVELERGQGSGRGGWGEGSPRPHPGPRYVR